MYLHVTCFVRSAVQSGDMTVSAFQAARYTGSSKKNCHNLPIHHHKPAPQCPSLSLQHFNFYCLLNSYEHLQLSLASHMSGCHAVFLLIIPSSCLCPGNEHLMECPIWKLLCGQWQETSSVEMNKT